MKIAIIAGHSASGKSTVLDQMCENYGFEKLVTTTTRDPRPGEVNGVDYHFITAEDFIEKRSNNFFIESVEAKGNFYGAGLNAFEKDFSGKTPAVILDPEGAKNASVVLREAGHTPITIFINEHPDTCVERVLSREASPSEKVKRVKDIREVESNWSDYIQYDFKTTPLSTIEGNCQDISNFVKSAPEQKLNVDTFKKTSKNKNRP